MGYIGSSPARGEDEGLLRGTAQYVGDISYPGCLEAAFARSYEAHGVLRGVDVSQARKVEGVQGVWSAIDLPNLPVVPRSARNKSPDEMKWPSLAQSKVRYAGEPVAVAVGSSRYTAEDAVELVRMDIDPLQSVLNPSDAATGAELFEGMSNIATEHSCGASATDVFETAPVVLEARFCNQRLSPTSIEPRAILAAPEKGGLKIWCSHQAAQRLRDSLAKALRVDKERIRVIVPKVGGAFGAKSQTYPEYIVVAYLALSLGKAIRWIEDRREALQAATHGRGQDQYLKLAASESGKILALDMDVNADIGAYPHYGEIIPTMTSWVMSGCYEIPRICIRIRSMLTTKTPTAAYRGAGRPEAAFAVERMVDLLARRLEIDPVTIRLNNFIPSSHFPYRSPTGALYDSGNYASALRTALTVAGYAELRIEQAVRRAAQQRDKLLGVGIASYIERSGGQLGSGEFGSVEVMPDGQIVARSGTCSQGQGNTTALAQIVATAFDVDLDQVQVIQGDTSEVPEGIGTFASRSVQVGGSALYQAALDVLREGKQRASTVLETAVEDIYYSRGKFFVVGTQRGIELHDLVPSGEPLSTSVDYSPPQAFPFGSYVVAVEVDAETGSVEIRRFVAVDDCGVVVNPKLVEGQHIGSIMQGIGQALYEDFTYDENGQPLASSLMDYSIPTIFEMPDIELRRHVTPNPNIPLGVKGAGESGCIGAPPAVMNAIYDALGHSDPEAISMPATPERIWSAGRRSY